MLSQALGGLRVVAEQYPELRATENFQQLSRNLSELEDEIQASRRIYNSNVQAYNTKIQVFPNSVIAEPRRLHRARVLRDRGRGRPRGAELLVRRHGPGRRRSARRDRAAVRAARRQPRRRRSRRHPLSRRPAAPSRATNPSPCRRAGPGLNPRS